MRTHGVDYRQMTFVINGLEGRKRRMQREIPIEVKRGVGVSGFRLRNGDVRAYAVVALIAERDYGGDSIHRTSLKDCDDDWMILAGGSGCLGQQRSLQERRRGREGRQRYSR